MFNKKIDLSLLLFSMGCFALLFLEKLPTESQWYSLFCILIILCLVYCFFSKWYVIAITFLLIGALWATESASRYLKQITPLIDQKIIIQAQVKSANITEDNPPNEFVENSYIQFSILKIEGEKLDSALPISLLWTEPMLPSAGQILTLKIKTKAVHSSLNEGGFDGQRFAIANRTLLTGTILSREVVQPRVNLRQEIINLALPYIYSFEHSDIILALAFGERSMLTKDHKKTMLKTGIAHLMAISGMHIVLVASIGGILTRGLQILVPNRFISPWQPLLIGWLCAIFFTWLSGQNPPALRAIVELSFWLFFKFLGRNLSSWQIINRIIALLLVIDPLMILSESFWLSCYAVICLIILFQWFPIPSIIRHKKRYYFIHLLHLQIALMLLLLPLQVFIFQGISQTSIVANLIAIPIVSFITFPSILVALILSLLQLSYLAFCLWFIADKSLNILFIALSYCQLDWLDIAQHLSLFSALGWLLLFGWRLRLWRHYGISCVMALLIMFTPVLKKSPYLWRVDMLDVGHGLAIVIRQGDQAILYDTGAKWLTGSAAERNIIPFLTWHNLTLDGVIISHEHNDHIGGLADIQKRYPYAWLMSSTLALNNDYSCVRGQQLKWHQLTFEVLWPEQLATKALNPESCVIKVSDGRFSILLTGDLEKEQEKALVSKYGKSLFSTILQIPHHGSNTSSTYPFLHYVAPVDSIASVARYNPWRLPSNKALFRYDDLDLSYHLTSEEGQISLFFNQDNWQIATIREKIKPRWYHDWFGGLPNYR